MHPAVFEQLRPDILTHYLSILQIVVEFNAGTLSMEFGLQAFMKINMIVFVSQPRTEKDCC